LDWRLILPPLHVDLTISRYIEAIEVGFEALGILGFPIPVDTKRAADLADELRPGISTDPEVIAVDHSLASHLRVGDR
jgi:hypothetical protein